MVMLVQLPLSLLATAADVFEHNEHVAKDDEGRWEDWPIMECHDELVSLELPHLIGDGLHLGEGVAAREILFCCKINTQLPLMFAVYYCSHESNGVGLHRAG